jgi:hypothetical protein
MKYILFSLLVFTTLQAQAQDWFPKVDHYYHYTKSDSFHKLTLKNIPYTPIIAREAFSSSSPQHPELWFLDSLLSIQIDTLTDSVGNIHYTPKKLLQVCDTCSSPTVQYRRTNLYPDITQTSSGQQLIILGLDTFPIPRHPINTSFHDTTKHLRGYSLYATPNPNDSQDTIVALELEKYTTPNRTFWEVGISKKYGIAYIVDINHDDINLIGSEGQDSFGYQSLQYDDIFDFNVGDQFYYNEDQYSAHGIYNCGYIWNTMRFRNKILSKQTIGTDTIQYHVENSIYVNRCITRTDTFIHVYTSNPLQPYNARQGYLSNSYINSSSSSYYLTAREYSIHSNLKYIGYFFELSVGSYDVAHFTSSDTINYIPVEFGGCSSLYKRGLGALSTTHEGFEHSYRTQLIGYIKGTDTVGITPDIVITSLKDTDLPTPEITIFPNPTHSTLYFSQNISGVILVYNNLGQILYQQKLEEATEIDLTHLPVGQYWIQWDDNQVIQRKQVTIMR